MGEDAIFTRKCCRTVTTKFGKATVYMAHDEHMGKCLFEDGFVTSNMPKHNDEKTVELIKKALQKLNV